MCINLQEVRNLLTINLLSLCVVSVRTTRVTTIRGVLLTCNLHCDYTAICSQHHERRYCESFFIVTILLTVFKQCFTPHFFHIDGLIKKIQKNTLGFSILKMSRRTPAPPHPRIIVLTPFNHDPQKIFTTFIHRHIDPVYGLFNVPQLSTILASLTHHALKKIIHFALQTTTIRC